MSSVVMVGPVLTTGGETRAIVEAIQSANSGVVVRDRGSYVRVMAPGRCVLPRSEVELRTGRPFALPRDLERVMASFKGRMELTTDAACWLASAEPRPA